MKKKISKRLRDREIYAFMGTDIPLLNGGEFIIYGNFSEKLKKGENLILSFDEIFEGFTYTKKERFLVISRLIRKKVIKRERFSFDKFIYSLIPKTTYRECKEARVYRNITCEQRKWLNEEMKQMIE